MKRDYILENVPSIAAWLMDNVSAYPDRATVLALKGDLGAGKTTITQAIAELLGVSEMVVSPTFVVAKFYDTQHSSFPHLIHIDAYRIESTEEMKPLHFDEMLKQPGTLIIIEWPENIASLLPEDTVQAEITHTLDGRTITI